MSNPQIETVQPDIFAKIASEPFFDTIAQFMIRKNRYQSEIDDALSNATSDATQAGTLPGVTIEVLMPMLKTNLTNAPGPVVTLEQRLIVKENPTINLGAGGVGLTAETVAVQLLQTLHQFYLGGICQALYPAPEAIVANRDFPDLVAYDVVMQATFSLTPLDRCGCPAPPVITAPETNPVPISFAPPASDPDAAIWLTTDGSFPGPGNAAASAYAPGLTVDSGTAIRWAAYVAGKLGSSTGMATITDD